MDTVGVSSIDGVLSSLVEFVIGFSSDFFAFIVVVAVVAAFSFYFGRDRLTPLIAGLYAALPLYLNFPFTAVLNGNPYLFIGLYIALALVGMVAFSGLAGFMASDNGSFFKVLGLSVLAAGLLLAIGINALPLKEIYTISPATLALFTAPSAFFWWLLAPLIGVFVLGK